MKRPKSKKANEPCFINEDNNLIKAVIKDVGMSDDNKYNNEQLVFIIKHQGKLGDMLFYISTGTAISREKYPKFSTKKSKKKEYEYNKFTRICLQLDLFSEDDLLSDKIDLDSLDKKLTNLTGSEIECELIKKDGEYFWSINEYTVKPFCLDKGEI